MDSLSPQVVSAAKLPILNPNEFNLWKMRIEQYFLMTDYSLWEVILNGPNPKVAPVAGHHWLDGDGMIHGLHIKDGKATYLSWYVKTSRLEQEEYFGGTKFMKQYGRPLEICIFFKYRSCALKDELHQFLSY
nr:carotenoid 9,10(9',10')-cleavage dioxygenase 1-like [Tanacetum cinerariifolium]